MDAIEIITKKRALELLKAAVAVKGPTYVDPSAKSSDGVCSYAAGNRPGCLIGHVLHLAGVPVAMLRHLDQLPCPGIARPMTRVFSDRESALAACQGLAERIHAERGVPVSGGYTWHTPAEGEPQTTADSTEWKTRWAVWEDICSEFPVPEWRIKR